MVNDNEKRKRGDEKDVFSLWNARWKGDLKKGFREAREKQEAQKNLTVEEPPLMVLLMVILSLYVVIVESETGKTNEH